MASPNTAPNTVNQAANTPEQIHFVPRVPNSAIIKQRSSGREDLEGLTVEDNQTRYVVISAGLEAHRGTEDRKVGLPRLMWTDPSWKGGRLTFARPTLKTHERPVGPPRLAKHGTIRGFERDKVALPKVDEPTVAVATYDAKTGEPRQLEELTLSKFYHLVDTLGKDKQGREIGGVKGNWGLRPDIGSHARLEGSRQLHINWRDSNGPRHDSKGQPVSAFNSLSVQLEKAGITKWRGVSLLSEKEDLHEIIFDGPLKQTSARGRSQMWTRNLVMRTISEDGHIKLEHMTVYKFADWLQSAKLKSAHFADTTGTVTETLEKQHREEALGDYLGWLATLEPQIVQAHGNQRAMEAYIDKQTERGAECMVEVSNRTALWLLDYADVIHDDDDKLTEIGRIVYSPEGMRRIDTLKRIIRQRGVLDVYDAAIRIRGEYLESMKKLNHPVARREQSISRVIEIMADELTHHPDLLDNQSAQERLIDRLVGRTAAQPATEDDGPAIYKRSLLRVESNVRPSGKVTRQGQPEYIVDERLRLNDSYFSAQDSPVHTTLDSKVGRQREVIREPAQGMAQYILEKLMHNQEPTDKEKQEFGRRLRRLAGD